MNVNVTNGTSDDHHPISDDDRPFAHALRYTLLDGSGGGGGGS